MPASQQNPSILDEESPRFVAPTAPHSTALAILFALSLSHLLNDTMQSLLPAIYPLLKHSFDLSFTQIGLITLTNQFTASLLQPMVGFYTDRYPKPYSLAVGMGFTLTGIVLLAVAPSFPLILIAAALVGMGSSVFHPEASRVARMASGGKHGFAQSLFQVGGNAGTSFGPLLAAWIILPFGQGQLLWFTLLAITGIVLLTNVGHWYRGNMARLPAKPKTGAGHPPVFNRSRLWRARHARHPRLLKIFLPDEHDQLLHVLPHRQVSGDEGDDASISSSRSSSPSRRERSSAARSATRSAASM